MKRKLKAFGLPIIVSILCLTALFLHQLLEQKKLPQDDWSRSLPLSFSSEEKPLTFYDGSDLFITDVNAVHHYKVQEDLHLSNEGKIATKVTRGFPFWSNGEQFIMKKDESLMLVNGSNEQEIDTGITGLSTSPDKVFYWKNNELYQYDISQQTTSLLHTFDNEVLDGYLKEDTAIFKVRLDDSRAQLFYMNGEEQFQNSPIITIPEVTTNYIEGLSYTNQDGAINIVYNEVLRAQGALSYYVKGLTVAENEIGNSVKEKKLKFVNTDLDQELMAPRSAQIITNNGESKVMFAAEGQRVGDNGTISLYVAAFDANTEMLQAKPISTTKHFTYSPIPVTGEEVVWFDYNGDVYELFGASQSESVISKSKELTSRSIKEGLNNAVLMLFSSMVTLFTSFYWVLPSLLILILLYMTKPNIFEREEINWVEYSSIVIFLAMPLTFISRAFNDYFYSVAPSYFTFSGSGWILLALFSVISAVIWKFGRDPEWGTFGGAFYFMGIYILLFITSIGPYIFNLF